MESAASIQNDYLQLAFNTLFSGFIIVILGSFIPRAVFRAKNLTLLSFFSSAIDFFHKLFYPVASVFVTMAKGILLYLFNVKIKDKDEPFAKIDLDHFLQQNRDLNEDNQELNSELFENALSLPMVKIRRCLMQNGN